jgi:photosystem II stability/assembly factor-like uncharacterized protein
MNRVVSAALAVLLCAGIAHSQVPSHRHYGQWRSSVIHGGGYLLDLIPTSDPNRYYVQGDVTGMFRSDDAGKSWTMLQGALPGWLGKQSQYVRSIIVDPRDPDRVLVAVGYRWFGRGGLFESRDAGKSWRSVLSAFVDAELHRGDGRLLTRDPSNPDRILFASHLDGVFESTDNGQSWRNLGMKGHPYHQQRQVHLRA